MKYAISGLFWIAILAVSGFCAISVGAQSTPAGQQQIQSAGKADGKTREMQQSKVRKILRFGVHVSAMGTLDPHFAAGSQDRALAAPLMTVFFRSCAPCFEPITVVDGIERCKGPSTATVFPPAATRSCGTTGGHRTP